MDINQLYTKIQCIGQGTYGIVYKAQNKVNKEIVAIKDIKFQSRDEGISASALREIALLKELKNDNIVKLYDVIHSQQHLTLIFEYCDYDLKRYMSANDNKLPMDEILSFSYQLLCALDYIHSKNIMHRDVKPQNILLNRNKEVKLADFGLARSTFLSKTHFSTEVITQWYRPPEILLDISDYGYAIDIWSAGCVIAEMITGQPLFPCQNDHEQIFHVAQIFGYNSLITTFPNNPTLERIKLDLELIEEVGIESILTNIPNDLLQLEKRLLDVSPQNRITASEALKLPVFSKFREHSN